MTTAAATLSIDRVAEAQVSSTVTTLLSTTASAKRTKIPLHNVMTAGLTHQASLVSTLAARVAASMPPGEDKEALAALLAEHDNLTRSISAQDALFSAEDHGTSLFADSSQLITSLYAEPAAHVQNSITDSQSKSVPYFGAQATGPSLDIELEDFLSTAFRVAAQNNLSHPACAQMIFRKLTSTARLIVKSHCEENRIQESDLQLTQLCHLLEQKFALFSSARAASQALSTLPHIVGNNYLSHVGKITRLTRLATRSIENQEQKELLMTTRGLEAFKACLSEADKSYLMSQERLRAQNNQQPLSLFKAAELLTTRAAEAEQLQQSNRAQLAVEDSDDEQVFFAGPGRGRYDPRNNGNIRNNANLKGDGNYRDQDFAARRPQQGAQGGRRGDHQQSRGRPSGARGRGRDGRRGGGYGQRGRQGFGRGAQPPFRGGQPLQGPMRRPEITPEQAGAKPGQCLACLGPHSYLSPRCQYFGISQLYPTPCKCGRGNHGYRHCLNRGAPRGDSYRARGRPGGQGARRVDEEENDDVFCP